MTAKTVKAPVFDPGELKITGEIPGRFGRAAIPLYNFPMTPREAMISLYNKVPVWQPVGFETKVFTPKLLPDNVARAFVFEDEPFDFADATGGPDMFGIEWEYVPSAFGSIVHPGNPLLSDANEWRDKIVMPDVDSWDWEGSAERNNATYLEGDLFNACWFQTGFFERLITFMDFEGALMALVDEDQKDAVHALFDKITDVYIKIFDKFITHFPKIDAFVIHDDWGSQKETFFSPAVAAEMIVPYMRKVTDYIHSRGRFCDLHSCGQITRQVPNMIAAGWDSWVGQDMNDTQGAYELYGDKIILGVIPDLYDPETKTEEEQRAAAKAYADKYCDPKKPSILNYAGAPLLTPVYREELYMRSRQNYSRD